MNIRVHLPSTNEGWEILNNRLAKFQSDFIINEINKLPYCYEKRLEILEEVIKTINKMEI